MWRHGVTADILLLMKKVPWNVHSETFSTAVAAADVLTKPSFCGFARECIALS
jgi:hypothetical protein